MASITNLMGGTSSSGSIYGNRNSHIISGLGSGLDTESMIEGMVQGYQEKITKLYQDRTKVQWKQEAYQGVSDKLVEFYRNYMSFAYSSSSNLFSAGFFNSAVTTTAVGKFAELVSATGKTNSDVVLNGVKQLAQTAKYITSGGTHFKTGATESGGKLTATGEVITEKTNVSNLEGTISVGYGKDATVTVDLGKLDLVGKKPDGTGEVDPKKLEEAINKQLADQKIDGKPANESVKVEVGADGKISFTDKKNAGNAVKVKDVTGKLKEALETAPDGNGDSIKIKAESMKNATTEVNTLEALSGKKVSFTLDGTTKEITLGENLEKVDDVVKSLQSQLDDKFGKGKVTVEAKDITGKDGKQGKALSFTVSSGSNFSVNSSVGSALGLGNNGLTSYLNMGSTLEDVLGEHLKGLTMTDMKTTKSFSATEDKDGSGNPIYKDADGNVVDKDGYLLDADGKTRKKGYELNINGKVVGTFTKDTAMDKVINSINSSDAGVTVNYSKASNQFVFTANESGSAGRVEIAKAADGKDTLGTLLFGEVKADGTVSGTNSSGVNTYTKGQDAIVEVTVNGKKMTMNPSNNAVEIDGLTISFTGTFEAKKGEEVTFKSETNPDTIVDAVKKMVEDYNKILEDVKDTYGNQPLKKDGKGGRYEPLTEKDKEGMTESEIKAYEEKAKTGILYMDRDLSSLYNSMRSVLTSNSGLLKSVGLSTEYSNGRTTLKLDETALRKAIAEDPDAVRDAFSASKENGGTQDGIMAQMKQVVDNYAGTSGARKGILIEKAGSKYSPTASLKNQMLDKMGEIDKLITKWQGKMADRVDYYTKQFSRMEVLLQQMNSQSSALAGLMGG